MRIELRSLTFVNFKGLKQLMIKFGHETDISGMNATGKTTIFDGFTWLMSGKDSLDRADFGIKTLDSEGNAIPQIDHEVIGQLAIWDNDSDELPRSLILRRIYREKWTKPRGQAEAVFSGHESAYHFDQVPCSEKEYRERLDQLCKENIFKLLTNPHYFTGLNWTVQRQALFSLIPNLSNDEIIAAIPPETKQQGNFEELVKFLSSKGDLADLKKKLASQIKTIQDELVLIPARIDEVVRARPEQEDWDGLEKGKKAAEVYIQRKEKAKTDRLASVKEETEKRATLQAAISTISQRMTNLKNSIEDKIRAEFRNNKQEVDEILNKIADYDRQIESIGKKKALINVDLDQLKGQRDILLKEWRDVSAEVFSMDENDMYCPVCKQELPEEMKANSKQIALERFNTDKKHRLGKNTDKGMALTKQIKELESSIANFAQLQDELQKEKNVLQIPEPRIVKPLDERLAENQTYQADKKEIEDYQEKLRKLGDIVPVDVSDLEKDIINARGEIEKINNLLAKREQIAKADVRKQELETQQQTMAQQIAILEQGTFSIETFLRTKVRMLEEKINGLFKLVRFKMFDIQVNGQLAETCECQVNGVPYSDLNKAARINAGIDIINTMSSHYGIVAPIFIDNREAVNEIIPTQSQLISLYVTKDKKLTIETR